MDVQIHCSSLHHMVESVRGGVMKGLVGQAYSCFLLSAIGDRFSVSSCNSTDLELALRVEGKDPSLSVSREGSFVVPADVFWKEVSAYKTLDDVVRVYVDGDLLKMESSRYAWSQSRFAEEDELEQAFKKPNEYGVKDAVTFKFNVAKALSLVEGARGVDSDVRQYDLDGVKMDIEVDGRYTLSATSRSYFGLFASRIPDSGLPSNVQDPVRVFLQSNIVSEAIRVGARSLSVNLRDSTLMFSGEGCFLFTTFSPFNFPVTHFHHTFLQDEIFTFKTRLGKKDVYQALRRSQSQVHETLSLRNIELCFDGENMVMKGNGEGREISSVVPAATLSGVPPTDPFVTDPDWLMEFVRCVKGDFFDLYYSSRDQPVFLVGSDEDMLTEGDVFFYVVTTKE